MNHRHRRRIQYNTNLNYSEGVTSFSTKSEPQELSIQILIQTQINFKTEYCSLNY